jgi:serine/threonine protein kinase
MSLSAGAKLGPYQVRALIGAGGMGEVYRARDTRLGRDVAIKAFCIDKREGNCQTIFLFHQASR